MASKEIPYTDAQIAEQLGALHGWSPSDKAIRRTYETDGWPITLMLVNALGFIAEAADHHPEWSNVYNTVEVYLTTHAAKGITQRDFDLAERMNGLLASDEQTAR